jgi:hypothetical protein
MPSPIMQFHSSEEKGEFDQAPNYHRETTVDWWQRFCRPTPENDVARALSKHPAHLKSGELKSQADINDY